MFLTALLAATAAAEPVALGEAVQRALSREPALRQAQEQLNAAEAGLAEAKLSRLPRLSAQTTVTRGDDPVYAFGTLLEQRSFTAKDFNVDTLNSPGYRTNIKTSLQLGVPLFTGFELTHGQELSRLQTEAASAGREQAAQGIRYQVLETYLRVLLNKAAAEEASIRIASATAELDEARRLKARGLVLGSDFYAAQAVLAGLKAAKIRAESGLTEAQGALAVLTGPGEAAGTLEDAAYAAAPAAVGGRPDLQQAAAAESAAAVMSRREAMSLLPRVSAFAAVETDTSDFGSNPANRLVGLRAELPFGDATYLRRRARADAAQRSARAGREAAEEAARLEADRRLSRLQGALAALPVLREAVEQADKSLELFRPLYREGRQSIFDVLRAEDALLKTREGYLETLYQAHAGYAGLRLAEGRLDAAAVAEMEKRLGSKR